MAAIDKLQPFMRQTAKEFIAWLASQGWQPVVTSVLRTYATQSRLYRRARSGRSRYPAARPGTSMHEYGRAFDVDLVLPEPEKSRALAKAGAVWESVGGRWGGRFRDPIHFEA